jgi:hypothetical protein
MASTMFGALRWVVIILIHLDVVYGPSTFLFSACRAKIAPDMPQSTGANVHDSRFLVTCPGGCSSTISRYRDDKLHDHFSHGGTSCDHCMKGILGSRKGVDHVALFALRDLTKMAVNHHESGRRSDVFWQNFSQGSTAAVCHNACHLCNIHFITTTRKRRKREGTQHTFQAAVAHKKFIPDYICRPASSVSCCMPCDLPGKTQLMDDGSRRPRHCTAATYQYGSAQGIPQLDNSMSLLGFFCMVALSLYTLITTSVRKRNYLDVSYKRKKKSDSDVAESLRRESDDQDGQISGQAHGFFMKFRETKRVIVTQYLLRDKLDRRLHVHRVRLACAGVFVIFLPWAAMAQTVGTAIPVNMPTLGGTWVTISGSGFGTSDASPSGRVGATACPATQWVSDSSISCKTPSGTGTGLSVGITVGQVESYAANVLSYDAVSVSSLSPSNSPATGAITLTAIGSSFATADLTGRARVGATSCAASTWVSDSILTCRVSSGVKDMRGVSVTVERQVGTAGQSFSFDAASLSAVRASNIPTSGSGQVTVFGANFGLSDHSAAARVGLSGCARSLWVSDTSVTCKVSSGHGRVNTVQVTVGRLVGTLTEACSFDSASVSLVRPSNRGATVSGSLTMYGSNFAYADFTSSARSGQTACEATRWISNTGVHCLTSPCRSPERQGLSVAVTVQRTIGSLSGAWTYDMPQVLGISPANCPSSGSCMLTLRGADFGLADTSVSLRVGATSCVTTPWISASSVVSAVCVCICVCV